MSHHRVAILAAAAVGALALTAPAALAQTDNNYPPASSPGAAAKKPSGPFHTRYVCAKHEKKGCFRTIQKAVDAAKAGDTVVVPDGTYKEAVMVRGKKKSYLKIHGNFENPERVLMDGGKAKRQNAFVVDGADNVTIRGFKAKDYGANGFFFRNVVGYTMRDLIAEATGKYGLYAFNSKGGTIRDSTAYYTNDGAIYIGQTPPQTRPIRTLVTGITGYGNVLGVSAENMRYVTVTKSRFYNNAIGIAFSAQDGEKYPPPYDNAVVDNDIFWNNFNYYKGAPFKINKDTPVPYPPGLGIVLAGGQNTRIENNRIFGHYVAGVASIKSPLTKLEGPSTLVGNQVKNNVFGKNGADRNGRDLVGDGNGSGNCWGPNQGVQTVFPEDPGFFPACPFTGANTFSQPAQSQMLQWLVAPDHEAPYIRYPHQPIKGITPLETWKK